MVKFTRLAPGQYRVESAVGVFIIRKLANVAASDFQWGVFNEQQKLLEYGYTKADCDSAVELWEQGQAIPAAKDYNLQYPDYLGSKRLDPGTYKMDTPVGVFLIRKLPQRKRGDFQWGIFSSAGEFFSDHFTRADCESLVRDWVSHNLRPTASPPKTDTVVPKGAGCLLCLLSLSFLAYVICHVTHLA